MSDPRILTVRPEPGEYAWTFGAAPPVACTPTGSARPSEDAFRISQLDLVRWLIRDHGFSEPDVYQVAPRAVE